MTRIYDRSFPEQTSLNTTGQEPEQVVWRRTGAPGKVAWFTDSCLAEALEVDAEVKVAWPIETPQLRRDPYDFIEHHPGLFDYVLSWWDDWDIKKLLYYPSGTRVMPPDRLIHPKTKMVSTIASPKKSLVGHRLRHQFIAAAKVDAFGPEYQPLPGGVDKRLALVPYRYNVVIQAIRCDWFFTEILIDCFVTGTVPIYWGCPSIGKMFDAGGIIQCATLEELTEAAEMVTPEDYESRKASIETNFAAAKRHVCIEDWIHQQYPFLFDE